MVDDRQQHDGVHVRLGYWDLAHRFKKYLKFYIHPNQAEWIVDNSTRKSTEDAHSGAAEEAALDEVAHPHGNCHVVGLETWRGGYLEQALLGVGVVFLAHWVEFFYVVFL